MNEPGSIINYLGTLTSCLEKKTSSIGYVPNTETARMVLNKMNKNKSRKAVSPT